MSRRVRLLTACVVFVASGLISDNAFGFIVKSAKLIERNHEFVLNADIDFRFSEEAVDALKHGVPLTIDVAMQVLRKRSYLWDETILDITLKFKIHYHALVRLFQVVDLGTGEYRNFVTLESAIEDLSRIRGFPVMKTARLNKKYRYTAKIRVGLDTESLPLPLRAIAYLSPEWYLNSPWYKWPLDE